MSKKSASESKTKHAAVTVPVRLPVDLDRKIADTAAQVGLSKQDTMRLSMERGLGILFSQLTGKPQAEAA